MYLHWNKRIRVVTQVCSKCSNVWPADRWPGFNLSIDLRIGYWTGDYFVQYDRYAYVHIHAYIYVYMNTCKCVYVCMWAYVYVYIYIYIYVYVRVYIHLYTYVYMYVCTSIWYICIYIYTAYPTCGDICKAGSQSSKPKLACFFLLKIGKRDLRTLASSFGNSFWKWHRRWDRLYMHTYMYIWICANAYMCVWEHMCMCTFIYIYVYVRVYIHLCTYA